MIEPTNRVSLVLVGLVPVATGVFENFAHRAEAVRLLSLRWIHPGCRLLFRRGQRAVGALAQVVSRHEQNKKFNQASNISNSSKMTELAQVARAVMLPASKKHKS